MFQLIDQKPDIVCSDTEGLKPVRFLLPRWKSIVLPKKFDLENFDFFKTLGVKNSLFFLNISDVIGGWTPREMKSSIQA